MYTNGKQKIDKGALPEQQQSSQPGDESQMHPSRKLSAMITGVLAN